MQQLSKRALLAGGAALALAPGLAVAQQPPIFIPNIVELSGAGAVSGTNWRDGIILAVEEINAKGGILGRRINTPHLDTQSDASIARAQVQKVMDDKPYVILGPVFSGSVLVTMALAQQNEIPEIVGGEAAAITQRNNQFVFRTSFGQQFSMPKIANYIRDGLKAKKVAVLWVNNDFGKGGPRQFRPGDAEPRHCDLGGYLDGIRSGRLRLGRREAEGRQCRRGLRLNTNEEESARFLREARKQSLSVPLIGETTLLSQKVIELAGDAANGVRGHVGLSTDAPVPALKEFGERFRKRFNYANDHNGIKGYTAVYMIKAVTEKMGKFDSKLFAETLKGMTIKPEQEPGILLEATWDKNGDIDRASFLGEVKDGKQVIVDVLPKLVK